MGIYDKLLELLFRILNVPFSVTGYSSFVTLISVLTSMWTCTRFFEEVVINPSPNPHYSNTEYDFIVGMCCPKIDYC